MANQLLDPVPDKEEKDSFHPEDNIAHQDYADKFNQASRSPDEQALADQATADDGFLYSPDPDRQALVQKESSDQQPAVGEQERNLYNAGKETRKTGWRGRLGNVRGKTANSTKKKVMLAVGGLFGAGGIAIIAAILFMIISGFSVKQIAEVMNIANMSRLHVASYRRTSQYLVEESLNPAGSSPYRVTRQGRTLFSRLQRFNPNEALGNLRQTGQLEFGTVTEERRSWRRLGRNTPITELTDIEFGQGWGRTRVELPRQSRWNFVGNYQRQRQFIKNIELAMNEHEIFKGKSRIYRTRTVNAILEATDIKLYRWVERGRTIRTFKDSILSAYERMRGRSTRSSNLPDVNEAAEDYQQALEDGPDNPRSGADLHDRALRDALDGRGSTLRNLARGASVAGLTATLYCAARDYVAAREDNAKDRVVQYKQAGALVQSASDQIESGDVTMNAVMMEAKRWEGFNTSQRYQRSIGNPNAANATPDLDRSESPVKDEGGALYGFFNGLIIAAEGRGVIASPAQLAIRHLPGKDAACRALNSTGGQVGLAVIENIASAVASVFTGGGATVGQQTARLALQQGFRQAARVTISREVRREIAGQFARRSAGDIFTFILIDQALKMVLNEGGNSAIDDAPKMYAKSDVGHKLVANDVANAWGGRPLTNTEVAEVDNFVKEQRVAILKKQSILTRLANLGDPLSPASQAVATLPYSPESLKTKGISFAQSSLNPFASIAHNSSRVALAGLGVTDMIQTASAAGSDEEDLDLPTIGFSHEELEKMLEPEFWPQQNAQYVESALESDPDAFDDVEECFEQMIETAVPACSAEQLSSDHAFHYRLYQMDGGNASETSGEEDYNDGILGSLLDAQEIIEAASGPGGPLPDGVVGEEETEVTQGCGGIRMHRSVISQVEALCAAAAGDGTPLTGSGWRSTERQIELRIAHGCGGSLIFDRTCRGSPPTAVPGRSNHEKGLAIDFANCSSRSTACFGWLAGNAARFGFFNLPSEPWHWSVDGR